MYSDHDEKQIFKFRLIETTYRQRVEWEDGPGSLRNIVSDKSERIVALWVGYKDLDRYIYPNEPDGWYDYSYRIERKAKGALAWEYHRYVDNTQRKEEDFWESRDLSEMYQEPEPQRFCYWCGTGISGDQLQPVCASCEEWRTEMERPQCAWCGVTIEEGSFMCKKHEEETAANEERYRQQRLEDREFFFSFQVHCPSWWMLCWLEIKLWLWFRHKILLTLILLRLRFFNKKL